MCQNGRPELWDCKWVGQVQVDAMGGLEMPRRRQRSQKKAVQEKKIVTGVGMSD